MLLVKKIHFTEDFQETVQEFSDDQMAACFDFATTLHAATMGLCEDEVMNEAHAGPYAIHITDEDGVSKWQECSKARCPQAPGSLLQ